ncbi:MAG TPA: Rab family GTPase [Candidatus Lokiarchaeia archaeon]|nr:Rab family GTPase [Candidatus Lokiarchaeia archaeon]
MTEFTSTNIIQSTLYSKFDQRAGPIPACWHPLSLDKDIVANYAIISMNIISGSDSLPEKLAILPVPDSSVKIVVRCITYHDYESRGFHGVSTLSLIIGEAGDAIFYKYLLDFEKIFNEYTKEIVTLEENKQPVKQVLIDAFFRTMTRRLEELRSQELGQRGDIEFPDESTKSDSAKEMECVFKIIVIGDPAVGKTSLILRFTDNAFRQTYLPTIGTNLSDKVINYENENIELVFWDIAGQSKFNKARKNFYKGAQGIIVVFDLTSHETFNNVKAWYEDATSVLGSVPCHVIGNKLDMSEDRAVDDEEITTLAQELSCDVSLTSALTGDNVEEVLSDLALKTRQALEQKPKKNPRNTAHARSKDASSG